jgi:hypothetical protein
MGDMETGEYVRCLHCKLKRGTEGRGLCRRCHQDRRVRIQYPMLGHDRKGVGLVIGKCLRGWEPTGALPGTPEKIRVLELRAGKGWPLWHPLDAKKGLG